MFFCFDLTSSGILIHFLPWQNLVVSSLTFSNPSHTLKVWGLERACRGVLEEIGQEQTYSPLGLLPCTALEYELFPLGQLNCHLWVHEGVSFQTHMTYICHDWGCTSAISQSPDSEPLWRIKEGNETEDPWFFLYQCRKKQSQSKSKRQSSRLHLQEV